MSRWLPSSLLIAALVVVSLLDSIHAHGYLSRPTPRGIEKRAQSIDSLKNPTAPSDVCRGEPQGAMTTVAGSVTLEFTITAPHAGPCEVYLLDSNLSNPRRIAVREGCVAPGRIAPWTVPLPAGVFGHKVLRWVWTATHASPPEHFEQCADLNIVGRGRPVARRHRRSRSSKKPAATLTKRKVKRSDYDVMESFDTNEPANMTPLVQSRTSPTPTPTPTSVTSVATYTSTSNSSTPTQQTNSMPTQPASSPPSNHTEDASYSTGSSSSSSSDSDSQCTPGAFKCDGNKVGQCVHHQFVWTPCGTGLRCHSDHMGPYCGY